MPSKIKKSYDFEFFKKEFCKSDEQIKEAENVLGCSLECFFNHYLENHYERLVKIDKQLLSTTFNDFLSIRCVNSIKSRVKDPYHLLDKLVRKVLKKAEYKDINLDNYHLYFDDLLGFRLILLYNEDWYDLHKEILNHYSGDKERFVDKNKRIYLDTSTEPFIISTPEINIRNGDDDGIYKSVIATSSGCKPLIKSGRYYRSIHYSVFYHGYCFEIQVRSVFDEAWSEVDHNLLYPSNLDNVNFINYSKMINRITGLSNEMSSYFKNVICNGYASTQVSSTTATLKTVPDELEQTYISHNEIISADKDKKNDSSAHDILDDILKGETI